MIQSEENSKQIEAANIAFRDLFEKTGNYLNTWQTTANRGLDTKIRGKNTVKMSPLLRSQVDQTQQKPASWFDKASNAFQTYVKPAASSLGQAASGTQQQPGGSPSWSDAANTLGSVFQNFGKSGSSGAQPPPPVVAQPPPPAAVAPPPAAIAQPAPAPGTQQQNPSSGSSWTNAANHVGQRLAKFCCGALPRNPAPEGNNFLDGVKNLFNNINASQIADKAAEFGKSVQAQIPAWTEEAKKVGESIQKAGADLLPKIQEGIASFTGSKNNTSN
ncbi:hypothetical protein U1Q18_046516 [Sarracenia purpurea var. burkii]